MRFSSFAFCALLALPSAALAQVDADEVNRNLQGGGSAASAPPAQDEDRRNGKIHLQGGRGNLPPAIAEHELAGLHEPVLLRVEGRGEAELLPDMAVIHSRVAAEAATAKAAIEASTRALNGFIDLLREAGIAQQDIQTTRLSLFPQDILSSASDPSAVGPPTRIARFRVVRAVTVRVRDLTLLDTALDRAASVGGITVPVVDFTSGDPSAALAEARRKAFSDAVVKGGLYAELADAKLGSIASISEGAVGPPTESGLAGTSAQDPAAADGPAAMEELKYSVTVQVTWRLTY